MQTFLPFACVLASVRRLDHKRLHAQLREAVQILKTLARIKQGDAEAGYRNHPAVLMWLGHELYLRYYACVCSAVIRATTRRLKDGAPYDTLKLDTAIITELGGWVAQEPAVQERPAWFGNAAFHSAHRARLYNKDNDFYKEFEPDSRAHDDYHWPVRSSNKRAVKFCSCTPFTAKRARPSLEAAANEAQSL